MKPVFVFVQFILGFSVVLYLIWPLLRSFGVHYSESPDTSESSEKRMVVDALADIEYEHETGKINDADYERLREHYLRRAADVFDAGELDAVETGDDETAPSSLEERIQEERKRLN